MNQSSRISEWGEEVDTIVVVQGCDLEFRAWGDFLRILAHDVERHVMQDGGILRSVVLTVSGTIFVHDGIKATHGADFPRRLLRDAFRRIVHEQEITRECRVLLCQ